MTSILPVSIPASGVSARPSAGFAEGAQPRRIDPTAPAQNRRHEPEARERQPGPRGDAAQTLGDPGLLSAVALTEAPLAADQPGTAETGRSPQARASDAYRKAGGEPPHYTADPRLFSISI